MNSSDTITSCGSSNTNEKIDEEILHLKFLAHKNAEWIREVATDFLQTKYYNSSTIKIDIIIQDNIQLFYNDIINESENEIALFDGYITKPVIVGTVMEHYGFHDLTSYIYENPDRIEDWLDIKIVYRKYIALYQNKFNILYPLDGDLLYLYYRKDILQYFNLTYPRTWDEYNTIAKITHNQIYNDPILKTNITLIGSCIPRKFNCADFNAYWANLLIGIITQTHGMSTGHLFDTKDFTILATKYPVIEQVLLWMEQQVLYGADNEFDGCVEEVYINNMINEGSCVLSYSWGNIFKVYLAGNSTVRGKIGIASTPGSKRVLDRSTFQLIDCNNTACPNGKTYPDLGRINQAPYIAAGGWGCAVNNYTSIKHKRLAMEFCSFASSRNESIDFIIPNATGSQQASVYGRDPFRRSQLGDVDLYVAKGYEQITTEEFLDTTNSGLNSPNALIDLHIPTSTDLYYVLEEEFHNYLRDVKNKTIIPDSKSRRDVAHSINERWNTIINNYNSKGSTREPLLTVYQKVRNVYQSHQDLNQIGHLCPYGYTAFGILLSSTIVCTVWTIKHRKSAMIRASQPFFLVLLCWGVLVFGSAIIPFGIDDSKASDEACSRACMAASWLVTMGWTTIFSALYAKLRRVNLVFSNASKMRRVKVTEKDVLKPFALMLFFNVTIMLLWNILDPLVWDRNWTSETSSYGRCVLNHVTDEGSSAAATVCLSLLGLVNFTALALSNFEAYKARKISVEYSESKFIGRAMASIFQISLIGLPSMFLVIDNPPASYFIRVSLLFLMSMIILSFIFGPKIRTFFKDPDERKQAHSIDGVKVTGLSIRKVDNGICMIKESEILLYNKLINLADILEKEGIDSKAMFERADISLDTIVDSVVQSELPHDLPPGPVKGTTAISSVLEDGS